MVPPTSFYKKIISCIDDVYICANAHVIVIWCNNVLCKMSLDFVLIQCTFTYYRPFMLPCSCWGALGHTVPMHPMQLVWCPISPLIVTTIIIHPWSIYKHFFFFFFQIMEEDLISTWTCFICKIPPKFEQAQYMWNQFLVNEKRMFVDDGLDISFKCIFCGTLFHARCLIDVQQLSPGDIPNIATDAWMCSACSFRP